MAEKIVGKKRSIEKKVQLVNAGVFNYFWGHVVGLENEWIDFRHMGFNRSLMQFFQLWYVFIV